MDTRKALIIAIIIVYSIAAAGIVLLVITLLDQPPQLTAVAQNQSEKLPGGTSSEPIELSSGNYIAGTDFPAGKYNVIAKSGTGTVTSSDMEIYAMLGVVEPDSIGADFYEREYKNIFLAEGVTLKVNGVDIILEPVS